jgi:sec-independent protein translocase protein TatC
MQSIFIEVRFRLFYFVASGIVTLFMSYYYRLELIHLIGRPLYRLYTKFIFLDLTEALYTVVEVCGMVTVLVMMPLVIYHLWSFFISSCYLSERLHINVIILCFYFFFVLEIYCIYFYIFPKVCGFLLSFEITALHSQSIENLKSLISIELTARIESYVKFLSRLFLLLLSLFQIPFVFYTAYKKHVITTYGLCSIRKFVFFAGVLLSAFISPPDVISQSLCTCLFVFLYEIVIYVGFFVEAQNLRSSLIV